jgi:hypothetical protein
MFKYSYRDIPLDEPLLSLNNIGPYLYGRLQENEMRTANDLLVFLDEFVEDILNDNVPIKEANRELTQWLSELTQNARPIQCVSNNTRVRQNRKYSYQVRYANKNAFNEIVKLWKYHTKAHTVHRRVLPALKTPRINAFPIACRSRN